MGANILMMISFITLIFCVIMGFLRGFIKEVAILFSTLAAIIIVMIFIDPLTDLVCEYTGIADAIASTCQKKVEASLPAEITTDMADNLTTLQQAAALDAAPIPDYVKNMLVANNNASMYERLGISTFVDYICAYLARLIVKILTFLVSFVLIAIILRIILMTLEIVVELPILQGINRMIGGATGAALWLVLLWIFFLFITLFCATGFGKAILDMIFDSEILRVLYQHNVLLELLTKI